MNGVGGDGHDESTGADRDATFRKELAHTFHSTAQALLRSRLARAKGETYFADGFILEEAQQNGRAVGFLERVHGFIEKRFDMRPVCGGSVDGTHLGSDLFAQLESHFTANDILGFAAGHLIEPPAEDSVGRKPLRVAGEFKESGLSDLFGELRQSDLTECSRINEAEMTADDLSERVLSLVLSVACEQFEIGVAHIQKDNATENQNQTKGILFEA